MILKLSAEPTPRPPDTTIDAAVNSGRSDLAISRETNVAALPTGAIACDSIAAVPPVAAAASNPHLTVEAMRRAGFAPFVLGPKEGLALLNGTQVSTALALYGLFGAESVFVAGLMAGALSRPHDGSEVIATMIGVAVVALGHDLNRRARH